MPTVFVLFSRNDPFSVQRSEMMVGAMVLSGVRYGRFTARDIDSATLKIGAQIWESSRWIHADDLLPDAILDFSLPGTPRARQEAALLSTIPHSVRIDLDRYDLLNLLARGGEFEDHIAPIRPLTDMVDVQKSLSEWGPVILKSSTEKEQPSLIVVPEGKKWRIHEPFSNRLVNESALHALIRERLDSRFFLQRFLPSRNPQGRQTILHLTLQQRGDGCWMTPDIRGVLATDGLFASLDVGGEFEGMPFKVDDFCPPFSNPDTDLPKLNSTVQRLGTAAARKVQELLPGPCATLGLSVAFDLQSKPWIVSVTPRPVAPRRPGKNMEFFRHLAQFALGLDKPRTSIFLPAPRRSPGRISVPAKGMTIRGQILPEQIEPFLAHQPPWVDLGVGNGGRALLAALGKRAESLNPDSSDTRPFISLRLGIATSDIIRDPQSKRPKIKATEDYIGGGILRHCETALMRSIRVPLLQAQLDHGLRELNGHPPDLLWLEDPDLGVRPLKPEERSRELHQTAAWFDKLCAVGQAGSWGVILFNPVHPATLDLLHKLYEFSSSESYLSHAGVRGASVPATLRVKLEEYGLHPVLIVQSPDSDGLGMTRNQPKEASRLLQWRPAPSTNVPEGEET